MRALLAMAKNRCIGKNGKLPWHYKEDLKFFKEFTDDSLILVGRKTFEYLPPLKNRSIWVLTFNVWDKMILQKTKNKHGATGTLVDYGFVIDCLSNKDKEIPCICGGKSVYESFISDITEFYVTHIDKEYDGDTFMFPFEHLYNKQELIKEFDFGKIIKYSK